MILKLRDRHMGGHVHVDVFIGPDADHLAKSGELVFKVSEWIAVGLTLAFGSAYVGEDGGVEVVGLEGSVREAKAAIAALRGLDEEQVALAVSAGAYHVGHAPGMATTPGETWPEYFLLNHDDWIDLARVLIKKIKTARGLKESLSG
jgi:hypothetical protein